MKKFICIVLILCIVICISGCSANVNDLLKEGKYQEALVIVEENPSKYADMYDEVKYFVAEQAITDGDYQTAIELLKDNKYKDASVLLNSVLNLSVAVEIENEYNMMLKEIEDYNPDKWNPKFDYMESSDFYLKIKDMLDETYDIIVRDNKVDNATKKFAEIFGYEPTTIEQAKNAITKLSDDLKFNEYYDSEFFYYHVLDYVMTTLTRESEFVRFELTDTSGFMIIEKPYEFLQSKGISTKVFAYLLGSCESMGASISRDSEKIIVTYKNTQTETYWSRGYFYCAPNSQYDEIAKFSDNVSVSIDEIGLDDVGVWTDVTITNEEKHHIKYLSMNAILVSEDGKHVGATSILLEDTNKEKISFTLDFDGMTLEDVKGPKCSVKIFPAVIMSE